MAKQVKLSARPRTESGRNEVKQVRARGAVPAVIYGGAGTPANLEISKKELNSLLSHAVGENILVDLEITEDGKTTNRLSLIQEVQHHPVSRDILHVDFHAVSATEEIEAEVVLESTGESIGVKTYGGLLQQHLRALPITCLPQNLPEIITVDVSHLNLGEAVHVKDITLPDGVTANVDGEVVAFLVSEPTVAAEPVAGAAAPEVLKEKKTEGAAEAKK
jgi:large subunit ribosomal protein L25